MKLINRLFSLPISILLLSVTFNTALETVEVGIRYEKDSIFPHISGNTFVDAFIADVDLGITLGNAALPNA